MAKMIKKVYAECSCHQKDHVLIFELETDMGKDGNGVAHDPLVKCLLYLIQREAFGRESGLA